MIRSYHGQTDTAEPHSGLQGESGVGGVEGPDDAVGPCATIRRSSESDHAMKAQLLEGAAGVFDNGARRREPAVDLKALHAQIGELTLENDFLEGALGKAGVLSAKR